MFRSLKHWFPVNKNEPGIDVTGAHPGLTAREPASSEIDGGWLQCAQPWSRPVVRMKPEAVSRASSAPPAPSVTGGGGVLVGILTGPSYF